MLHAKDADGQTTWLFEDRAAGAFQRVKLPHDVSFQSISPVDDLIRFDMPIAYVSEGGSIIALAFPPVFFPDIYFMCDREKKLVQVATRIDHLMKMRETCTLDSEAILHVLSKGYCLDGESLVEEVPRASGCAVYAMREGRLDRQPLHVGTLLFRSEDESYEEFKRYLNIAVDSAISRSSNRKHYLLLSGGVDSRLLLLLLKKKGVSFEARTSLSVPNTTYGNACDVDRAEEVCGLLGVDLRIGIADLTSMGIDEVRNVADVVPCSPHPAACFLAALKGVDVGSVIWTGQNMDALYGFGPTERTSLSPHGVANVIKRFYLSEQFQRGLAGVEGASTPLDRIVARAGLGIFKLYFKDRSLSLPTDLDGYLSRFKNSDDYTVFHGAAVPRLAFDSEAADASLGAVKSRLLGIKLPYLRGGDALAISAIASQSGSAAVFPYSSIAMLPWFNSGRYGVVEVLHPKRFVYRYVREISNEIGCPAAADFSGPSKRALRRRFGRLYGLYANMDRSLSMGLYGKMVEAVGVEGGVPPSHDSTALSGDGGFTISFPLSEPKAFRLRVAMVTLYAERS